jgi:hypothetical protein
MKYNGKTMNPIVKHALETKLIHAAKYYHIDTVLELNQLNKELNLFGPQFSKCMFDRAVDLMSSATLREMIDLYINFEEHRNFLDESFISKVKKHVVYEIHNATTLEVFSLLGIFK